MIGQFSIGVLTFGIFSYWIGFSWRYVGGMGRVVDLGFFKVVRWGNRRSATRRSPNA